MKVVLDTNIWLSGIFWKGEAYKLIETCLKKEIKIIITQEILSEIASVLSKEAKFQDFIRQQCIEDLVRTILSVSYLIETKIKLEIIKEHPKDNIILEAAIEGNADYIVSYDKHILNILEFRKIKILNPEDFLNALINKFDRTL